MQRLGTLLPVIREDGIVLLALLAVVSAAILI